MNKNNPEQIEEYIERLEQMPNVERTPEMEEYEKETGKYAVWRGVVTEGFKTWLRGGKIYNRDKERISLYVSENTKEKWQNFIKESNFSTISKLIRQSVKQFIHDQKEREGMENFADLNPKTISNISHSLKEPLTTIKGFSQLILENYKEQINDQITSTIRNIFDQSILLENKIVKFLDNIKQQHNDYDILLIEDDLATIRLITSYFESKGYICKGVVSGSKGLEELRNSRPKLILLDIILPDLSGYDICKTIKGDEDFKSIPVYFLTAIAGSEVEKKLNETGADGFILKPFNFADFEVIFKLLEKN
ncbi:MAG: response regulator [Candidatus Lokiarchaeota archaeon]|nr:response regulator [Candidatus Lokiarchaeota archaeon]MBD3199318.1 response regulator [Candidatus Lokiarchaeota archaeon]